MSATSFVQAPDQKYHRLSAREIIEASVHLPKRGKEWVASYRDETGRQRWRTTGLTDRSAAMVLANEWEAAARRQRTTQPSPPRKPVIRVRRGPVGEASRSS